MLILLIIAFGFGYWLAKDSRPAEPQTPAPDQSAWLQRIINALVFTAQDEIKKSRSKAAKAALQRVIDAGYKEQYGYVPKQEDLELDTPAEAFDVDELEPASAPTPVSAVAEQPKQYVQGPNLVQQTPARQDIDNTSLLLYFGAFLFITSIGLFVGFSDIDGTLRTLLVGVVAFIMYTFGFWLHQNKKKLREVGLTFIGIGMSALPFIGLAAYYYVYDESYGPAIWVATSVVTALVYLGTLLQLRNTLVSYMLIASIISLFQSSVSILEAPAYYYIWMMMGVGIILHAVSLISDKIPEFKDASAQSARFLIPLTLIASFLVSGTEGTWQFAVTMLIASAYYGLQAVSADSDKEYYLLGSHTLAITGLATGAYSLNESITDVSTMLLVISAVHTAVAVLLPRARNVFIDRFYDVSLLTIISTILISIGNSDQLTISFALGILLGAIITFKTTRHDSFVFTIASWVIMSVVLGQVLPDGGVSDLQQAFMSFGFTLPLIGLMFIPALKDLPSYWIESVRTAIVSLHVVALAFSFFEGEYGVLWLTLAAVASCILLAETLKDRSWVPIAITYSLVPSLYVVIAAADVDLRALPLFTLSVLLGLAVNIGIALRYKLEAARWVSAVGWIALPFALGVEEIGDFDLSASLQMWLYLAAGIALSISRAIARGRILRTKGASLSSMDKDTSLSYGFGLAAATGIAVVLAFASTQTYAESTLVIALAGVIMIAGGTLIDREPQYVALAPHFMQAALLRFMEPYDSASWLNQSDTLFIVFAGASSAMALATYAWTRYATSRTKDHVELLRGLQESAIVTLFFAPLSFLVLGEMVWMMPVTLMVAAGALLHWQWYEGLSRREAIGFVGLGALYWLMFMLDVSNIHIYTHIFTALMILYGYVRYRSNDADRGSEYWTYGAAVAAIPLALQALSGEAYSEWYGIALMAESILVFAIGYQLKATLLRQWGQYMGMLTIFILMYVYGVRNIQAYTHVLAAIFAVYGIVARYNRDEILANQYFAAMLSTATVPLILQTLGDVNDGRVYGIWLLLENILFFLIGITFRIQLITRWGLYVSVGVVLYELRDLGWAMLSILALVLIGVGAYRAMNQPDEPEK